MKDINKFINVSNRLNLRFKTEKKANQNYSGYYNPIYKELCIVEFSEDAPRFDRYNGEELSAKRTFKNVFAHEVTHHLQTLDGKYKGMESLGYHLDIHRNGIYAYNEIVANTVSMLLYMSDDTINDNIAYCNRYIKRVASTSKLENRKAFDDRMERDLENDVQKYYSILRTELEKEGLL